MMPAPVTTVTIPHRPAPPSLCLEHPSSPPPPQLFLFLQASGPSRKVSQSSLPRLVCLCQGCIKLAWHSEGASSLHPLYRLYPSQGRPPLPAPHSGILRSTATDAQRVESHTPPPIPASPTASAYPTSREDPQKGNRRRAGSVLCRGQHGKTSERSQDEERPWQARGSLPIPPCSSSELFLRPMFPWLPDADPRLAGTPSSVYAASACRSSLSQGEAASTRACLGPSQREQDRGETLKL